MRHSPVLNNKNSSSVSIQDVEDIAMENKLKGLVQRAESPVSIPEEEENEYTKAWKAWWERDLERERVRNERLKKAEESKAKWELMRECRKFIQDNSSTWMDRRMEENERAKKLQEKFDRESRQDKARKKKQSVMEKYCKKIEPVKISSLQEDEKRLKKMDMAEMKRNLWKNWRDGSTPWNRRKISNNIKEMEVQKNSKKDGNEKRKETRLEDNEVKKQRKEKAKKLEESWESIRECIKFLEENVTDWEKTDGFNESQDEVEIFTLEAENRAPGELYEFEISSQKGGKPAKKNTETPCKSTSFRGKLANQKTKPLSRQPTINQMTKKICPDKKTDGSVPISIPDADDGKTVDLQAI